MSEYNAARLGCMLILILGVFLLGFLLGGAVEELKTLREINTASRQFRDATRKEAKP